MAEVAAGAVSSLLGVIRTEARLLRLVRSDVQFIKEEMESMNSFLAHLSRSAPPGCEHDEQVRTWMNQVRLLAQDCNNCIDLYLYRGNPDIHRARGSLRRRYLWWVYWFLHKLVAQHRAAVRLSELKNRARDVGERRLRYGVEVPSKSAVGQSHPASRLMSAASSAAAADGYAAAEDVEDDVDDDQLAVADHSVQRALFSHTLDDYVKTKLIEWSTGFAPTKAGETMSIAIVAPDRDLDALRLAHETAVFHPGYEYNLGYSLDVLIDIPAVHPDSSPLRPKDILYYTLRQLKLKDRRSESQSQKQGTDQGEGDEEGLDSWQVYIRKLHIYHEKKRALNKIKENLERMKIYEKLDKIKSIIKTHPSKGQEKMGMVQQDADVYVLLQQLLQTFASASQQDKLKNKGMPKLSVSENTITKTALKLKELMEADEQGEEGGVWRVVENEAEVEEECEGGEKEIVEEKRGGGEILEEHGGGNDDEDGEEEKQQRAMIYLHEDQYVQILRQVFLRTTTSNKSASKQVTDTTLGEDQIKQMIKESNQEVLRELQEDKHDRMQETGQKTEDIFLEIVDQKMYKIKKAFKEQLKIKGLVDDIRDQLKSRWPLFILKIDETVDLPRWEDTRNAFSLLECCADVLIITTAKDIQQAKAYCYPQREPIDYSLVGLYQRKNEENYDPQIFCNILELCEPNEFCMKIFTHALSINPKRSNEELNKLHKNLQASPKSFDVIAKKMFKFSYTDMPKEYKSCLLYLAIFPPRYKIRRSTLIGRWVAEGLISREDWPSSVQCANRCFDELINRWFTDPAATSAAGKVKSCVVGDQVHGLITEIARKQHIVETRLSQHMARYFSIFNDLQLRSSDKIDGFFQRLSKSSQVSLIKVLDLEGCPCFGGKNQRYLKDICSKMLLLKYLSLRRTNVTELPSKINNLHKLEVLDIRQTSVPTNATANVLLLKLKRLLAGHTDQSRSSSVQIPHKIEKMVNMEVLSNVKARRSQDFKDIGKLWQLRKLGVVVDDNSNDLENLLRAISDLHECLCSLSITLPRSEGTPCSQEFPQSLKRPPKLLESLSISGTTQMGHLLPLFIKDVNNNLLNKLTLSYTSLNQNNLEVLTNLPKLQSIRLRHIAFTEKSLVFKEKEFRYLKYLLVEGSSFTKISFKDEAVCMLEKMVLSFTDIESVSGVGGLQKLEEVELTMSSSNKKNNDMLLSSFNNGKLAKLTLVSTSLEQDDQATQITFNEGEFRKLKLITIDCSATTEVVFRSGSAPKLEKIVCASCTFATTKVVFTSGSAPKLEKIVWSSSTSLDGIENLPRLKELEFNGDLVPEVVKKASNSHKNKLTIKHNKPEIQDQAKGDEQEDDDDDAARFSLFCWKKQV